MVDIKAMAAATAPREFELSYTTTIEDVYEKLSTLRLCLCVPAFQPHHYVFYRRQAAK